jgi:hypothetical protein
MTYSEYISLSRRLEVILNELIIIHSSVINNLDLDASVMDAKASVRDISISLAKHYNDQYLKELKLKQS